MLYLKKTMRAIPFVNMFCCRAICNDLAGLPPMSQAHGFLEDLINLLQNSPNQSLAGCKYAVVVLLLNGSLSLQVVLIFMSSCFQI